MKKVNRCPACNHPLPPIPVKPICWICQGKSANFYNKRIEERKKEGDIDLFGWDRYMSKNAEVMAMIIKPIEGGKPKHICKNCAQTVRLLLGRLKRKFKEEEKRL